MNEVFMAIKSTIYWMLRGHDMRMNGVQRFTEKVFFFQSSFYLYYIAMLSK